MKTYVMDTHLLCHSLLQMLVGADCANGKLEYLYLLSFKTKKRIF